MNSLTIKTKADGLIKKYGLTVPIDVERLADLLGIPIEFHGFQEEISGFSVAKHGERLIGVNSKEGNKRQRFTIAHELGHLMLHKNHTVNVDSAVMLLRDSHSSSGNVTTEIEANRFAAELLMPESEITKDLEAVGGVNLIGTDDDLLDSTISKLASKYDVSYQAMSVRLASLYFG